MVALMLISDTQTVNMFSTNLQQLFWVALGFGTALVAWYAFRSIYWTVKTQIDEIGKPPRVTQQAVYVMKPPSKGAEKPEQIHEFLKTFTTLTEGQQAQERQPIILQVGYSRNPNPPSWSLL